MSEIRGYTAEEIAEERRIALEKMYANCKDKEEDVKRACEMVKEAESEYQDCKNEYFRAVNEYRRRGVDRVLSYIRHKGITDAHELDVLLCHCQNKLNGNIDGTELNLHYEEKSEEDGKV